MPKRAREDQLFVSGYNQTDGDPRLLVKSSGFVNRLMNKDLVNSQFRTDTDAEIAILMMMCLPEEAPPVQYADQFSIDKSAVKAILQRDQCSWQDVPEDPDNAQLRPTETFAVWHRGVGSLWRRLQIYDPNKNLDECGMILADSETLQSDQTLIRIFPEPSGQMNFNMAVPIATTTYRPHGDTLIAGRSNDKPGGFSGASWIWVDGQPDATTPTKFEIEWVDTTQIVAGCSFSIYRWNLGAPVLFDTIEFVPADSSASKLSANITVSDYWTITYSVSEGVAADDPTNNFTLGSQGVQITFSSFCSVLKTVQVEGAYQNITQLGVGFTIAGSARYTDIAPPLEIEGMAAIANTREPWTWLSWYQGAGGGGANSIFGVASNYKDSYAGPLRLGGYGIDVPHTATDFKMGQYCDVDYKLNIIKDIYFDMNDTSIVNVFCAKSQNTGSNSGLTGQGCDMWYTLATHFTFSPDNKWVSVYPPRIDYTVWAASLQKMRWMPRGMENRTHRGNVFRFIFDRGIAPLKKYLPSLIRAAGRGILDEMKDPTKYGHYVSSAAQLFDQAYRNQGSPVTLKMIGNGQ